MSILSGKKQDNQDELQIVTRVERNFEKLPIWSPKPKRTTVFAPSKVIELEPEQLPDGNVIQRRVKIVPSAEYGYPTTQTQEIWYALQKLWRDSPTRETGRVEFSRRQIIEDVLGKANGNNPRKALELSIMQLATALFQFDYTFYDKAKDEYCHELRGFSLITDFHLTARKSKHEVTHDKCFVTLHPLVVSNLRSGYFKPILLSVVSQLKSDIARLLYRRLDSHFTHYKKFEISTARFFREHGLEGSDYAYPSARKRLMDKAVQELINKPTSSGAIIKKYEFTRTAESKDWKLIVRAIVKQLIPQEQEPPKAEALKISSPQNRCQAPSKTQDDGNHSSPSQKPVKGSTEALEAISYFHEIFGSQGQRRFTKNVVLKAEEIVKKHGLEKAKFLVDFAHEKISGTAYSPKTFSGIVTHMDDALAAWDERERIRKRRQEQEEKIIQMRLENARSDHETTYCAEYHQYIDQLLVSLEDNHIKKFEEFRHWQAQERSKHEKVPNAKIREVALRHFDSEGAGILRLCQFFKKDSDVQIPDFWEWDAQHNPQSFGSRTDREDKHSRKRT